MSWDDLLPALGCEWAAILLAYLFGRARIWWIDRPFREVSPYIPPIVSVCPPTVLTESDQSQLWG